MEVVDLLHLAIVICNYIKEINFITIDLQASL
jgi:hypothetical protein